ncbi:hypothetical protein [Phytoactinopolyspora limicola]|uniref:hypothetical protein n=1 Tax=Phytoactinopolyspora limicola TaxID=2715536 RepID=UPI00140C8CE2|nr:hypothetical protein [Phytoactinopolyspora limicola]
MDPRPAIAEFWSWWAEHRDEVVAALDGGRTEDVLRLVQPWVMAIDERLTWDITGSEQKRFGLVVTTGGHDELRSTTERWRLSAPDDPEVEFLSTRRRDPAALETAVLDVDGYEFALREMVVGARVDTTARRVDVIVHHPLFTLVDQDHRLRVAFHGLDVALGEAAVERWLGAVNVSVDAPIDAIALTSLEHVVAQLAGEPAGAVANAGETGDGGEWAAMKGQTAKGPVFVIVRRSANRYTHPLVDTHLAVVLTYEAGANGMPLDPSISQEIEELEGHVIEALGGEGPHALHVGHVTGGGQVVAHFYLDGLERDPELARPVLDKWSRGKVSMAMAYDPLWEHVAPFLR